MSNTPQTPGRIMAWQMVRPCTDDTTTGEVQEGILKPADIPVPELGEGDVLVEIAGCGVCRTDLSYFYHGVPTLNPPPLTLGHEITGTVVAGKEDMIGKEVIIPAVMPCGSCDICLSGRGNRCLAQKMPGNSLGIYGGFASHIPVPARDLCVVEDRGPHTLAELAVIADACTTPYQAATRASLKKGDNVIVIGTGGGVGVYMTQIAKALGARTVIGMDIDEGKLERALQYGADHTMNVLGKDDREVVAEYKRYIKERGLPAHGWKIFEVTGTDDGQSIALGLLSFVGKLVVIGFGMQKNQYPISRLMALDAEIIGTWGCLPRHYPRVLDMVISGSIMIDPFVELRPMSTIRDSFEDARRGQDRRIILTPDF